MSKFIINKEAFIKVNAFKSKEDSRFYLQGVYITPATRGVYLIATCGHKLALWHDKTGTIEGKPQIIRVDKNLISSLKKDKITENIQITENEIALVDITWSWLQQKPFKEVTKKSSFNELSGFFIDGTFPDWERTFPSRSGKGQLIPIPIPSISVNAKYINEFALGERTTASVNFTFYGEKSPVVIRNYKFPEFLGLLMPIKNDSIEEHLFLKERREYKKAA